MNEYMKETNEALLHTYNQFPVVLERGEGAYLYPGWKNSALSAS